MAITLYFVQSDTLPQIKFTLIDEITGAPIDLTGKTVHIHAKPASGFGVSFTREAIFPGGDTDKAAGIAYIQWHDGDLNRPAGDYNAEIEIFDPDTKARQTVFELIKLVIREDIADIPTRDNNLPLVPSSQDAPNAAVGG